MASWDLFVVVRGHLASPKLMFLMPKEMLPWWLDQTESEQVGLTDRKRLWITSFPLQMYERMVTKRKPVFPLGYSRRCTKKAGSRNRSFDSLMKGFGLGDGEERTTRQYRASQMLVRDNVTEAELETQLGKHGLLLSELEPEKPWEHPKLQKFKKVWKE